MTLAETSATRVSRPRPLGGTAARPAASLWPVGPGTVLVSERPSPGSGRAAPASSIGLPLRKNCDFRNGHIATIDVGVSEGVRSERGGVLTPGSGLGPGPASPPRPPVLSRRLRPSDAHLSGGVNNPQAFV